MKMNTENEVLTYLVLEVKHQCDYAIFALEDLHSFEIPEHLTDSERMHYWYKKNYYMYSFLIHTSNISKLLWPSKSDIGIPYLFQYSDFLRCILQVDDKFYIKDRTIRNDLEHMDERIKNYFENKKIGKNYKLDIEGSHSIVSQKKLNAEEDQAEVIEKEDGIILYEYKGKKYNLEKVKKEINNIKKNAIKWLAKKDMIFF